MGRPIKGVFAADMAATAPAGISPANFAKLPEATRIALILAKGIVPDRCGDAIPSSPARGPFRVIRPLEVIAGSAGAARHAGYMRRDAICRADVFDLMDEQARRLQQDPPFAPAQIQIARDYRGLSEQYDAGAIRCASLEAARGGGGGGGFIDAFINNHAKLSAMQKRLAGMVAMTMQRQSAAATSRSIITSRRLVDMVCVDNMQLSIVLRTHGWPTNGANRGTLRMALSDALDRMIGYAPQ